MFFKNADQVNVDTPCGRTGQKLTIRNSIENAIESVEVQAKYILIYVHNYKHFSTLQLHGQLLAVSREFKYKNTEQESWSPE